MKKKLKKINLKWKRRARVLFVIHKKFLKGSDIYVREFFCVEYYLSI